MYSVLTIPAFQDNYIWLIRQEKHCLVVDPGSAGPVLERLDSLGLALDAILLTHHHQDHTGGVTELLTAYPNARLYQPRHETQLHFDGTRVEEGDQIRWHDLTLSVLHVPGHTRGHVAYHGGGMLFCGDTLFSAGCGRLFEGSAEEMYDSLQRLLALPDETRVYPAHEYTLSNLRFAHAVEPQNRKIAEIIKEISKLRQQGLPSLPTTLGRERDVNVFLRCHLDSVRFSAEKHALSQLDTPQKVFHTLRLWKDVF